MNIFVNLSFFEVFKHYFYGLDLVLGEVGLVLLELFEDFLALHIPPELFIRLNLLPFFEFTEYFGVPVVFAICLFLVHFRDFFVYFLEVLAEGLEGLLEFGFEGGDGTHIFHNFCPYFHHILIFSNLLQKRLTAFLRYILC